jgi:hypothetical protein
MEGQAPRELSAGRVAYLEAYRTRRNQANRNRILSPLFLLVLPPRLHVWARDISSLN